MSETLVPDRFFRRYGVVPVITGIRAKRNELKNCQLVQDLHIILDALERPQTFPSNQISVGRDSLQRIAIAVFNDIYRGIPFREALPMNIQKTLSDRKRMERSADEERAIIFLGHLMRSKTQNVAIEDTAAELNIDRKTVLRSLNRLTEKAKKE